jgi:hypothetical protein
MAQVNSAKETIRMAGMTKESVGGDTAKRFARIIISQIQTSKAAAQQKRLLDRYQQYS